MGTITIPAEIITTREQREAEALADAWTALRTERDRLLAESDKAVMPFVERGEPAPSKWQTYRQALRDLPENTEDLAQVVWPGVPGDANGSN